jgi:hypothetical protein
VRRWDNKSATQSTVFARMTRLKSHAISRWLENNCSLLSELVYLFEVTGSRPVSPGVTSCRGLLNYHQGKAMRFTSHQKGLYLDELCLLLSFSALCVLAATGESQPLFESFGNGRLTMMTVLGLPILFLLAATMGRAAGVRSFIAAYWPIVGTLAVYESLKHLHANRVTRLLGIAPKDDLMLHIDEILFGRALPLHLQGLATPYFVRVMGFFYIWVYYVGPVFILSIAYFV